jgi:hypothetical protein
METVTSKKIFIYGLAWWLMPAILATQEDHNSRPAQAKN